MAANRKDNTAAGMPVNRVQDVRERLLSLAEEDYREFNMKLLPGVERVMGVRLPAVRKVAKQIAKGDFRAYLDEAQKEITTDSFHEEIMAQGLVLGYAKMNTQERRAYLDEFVPKIQNWAVCDSCVNSFDFMAKEPQYWFEYLKGYMDSEEEYEIRFMVVSMMSHFIDEEHIDEILKIFGGVHHDGYYAKMGNAWAISMCYVKFPQKTRKFLENDTLDDFTHNKAIQKIRESYRVSKEEKEDLKTLKR